MKNIGSYVDGKIIEPTSTSLEKVFDSSTGEQIGNVLVPDKNFISKVVDSSKKAFDRWSKITPLKRSRVLFNYKKLLEENIDKMARVISIEHGKTFDDAQGSITRGIEVVEFATGIPHLLKGEFSQNVGSEIDSWSQRYPLGICLGITPFNFPAMVPLWMFPISIACGNSFILKPSEKDPTCSLIMAELFSQAGLPDGVLNVINGNKDTVNQLIENAEISSVSFVGSTPVAKQIYEKSSKFEKRVQALGGAKNHLVVMPDANLSQAVDGIIGAGYGSAGERCMAISVAVAVGDIADELVSKIHLEAQKLKVAPWTDSNSDMGPVISKDHKEKIENYISVGVKEGATLIEDGRNYKIQGYENGYFVGPTLFDNVTKEMTIYKEEIFGPVVSVVRAQNYDDALKLVNDHAYGNGTSIYTSDGEISRHFTTHSKIGMVGVNVPIPVPMAFHSFGGWKQSLFGDHSVHGMEGIHFYTKLKTITSRWPKSIQSGPEFVLPTN